MENTIKLKVRVTEKTTKDGKKSFLSYKTFSGQGRATELKFRQEVTNPPKKDCYIICNKDDVNLNTSGEYPVCWVKAIIDIEDPATANAENNRKKLDEYFGQ